MRLYRFHMPDTSNSGACYLEGRERFKRECLRLAGGYTEHAIAQGAWRDEAAKADYIEYVWPIDVAVEDGKGEATRRRLVTLFKECFPDQLAVFSAEIGQAWIE